KKKITFQMQDKYRTENPQSARLLIAAKNRFEILLLQKM
ncbi:unnamed protein product, partial [Rotaria magnacalcarata]